MPLITSDSHGDKDFVLKRQGKGLGGLVLQRVEVLDYDVKAALGELGLLAEVQRLLLKLGGRRRRRWWRWRAVHSGRDGRSIAGRASRGWPSGDVLHRLGSDSGGVLQAFDGYGIVLQALVDGEELGGEGVGCGGGGGEELGGGGGGGGEEGKLGSQRATHGRHICGEGCHVLHEAGLVDDGADFGGGIHGSGGPDLGDRAPEEGAELKAGAGVAGQIRGESADHAARQSEATKDVKVLAQGKKRGARPVEDGTHKLGGSCVAVCPPCG
eukprot:jgi/Mesvir1/2870/Mv25449-RA.1